MILQSLCRYYDILAGDEAVLIPKAGTSSAKIHFGLVLSPQGEIKRIMDLRILAAKGKKLSPRLMQVPEQPVRTSGIKAFFLSDKNEYVLGIDGNNVKLPHFEAFRALQLEILQGLDDPDAVMVRRFVENWQPEKALELLPQISGFDESMLAASNFVLMNEAGRFIHQNELIDERWQIAQAQTDPGALVDFCLIDGQKDVIAMGHPQLKGVRDAQPTGASMVSYNAHAFQSYGKKDGDNSPVSIKNAFKYTTVLNWLLQGDSVQKTVIGDSTVVFWAECSSTSYIDMFSRFTNPEVKSEKNKSEADKVRDEEFENEIRATLDAFRQGRHIISPLDELDPQTNFYILALAPNNARVSVRYFLRDTFGALIAKINRHYEDLKLAGNRWEYPPLWLLLSETIPRNSRDKKAAPPLASATATAVFTGGQYPQGLLNAILQRIRADHEVNDLRVAMIKAYLQRKDRLLNNNRLKEVLTMSLNTETTNQAYLLGRLFAVLERTQEYAQGDINKTIKDSYFSTASASPRAVFAQLIKLSQHHLAKLGEKGRWLDIMMGRIMNNITTFPANLDLEEQSLFILGYYQQRQDFFTKKADRTETLTETQAA